jgi:hypothetical protein
VRRLPDGTMDQEVDPVQAYGNDVLKLIKEALNQTPDVIAVLKNAPEAKEETPQAK